MSRHYDMLHNRRGRGSKASPEPRRVEPARDRPQRPGYATGHNRYPGTNFLQGYTQPAQQRIMSTPQIQGDFTAPPAFYDVPQGRVGVNVNDLYGFSKPVMRHEYGHMFDPGWQNDPRTGLPSKELQRFTAYANQERPLPNFPGMYGNPKAGGWTDPNPVWGGPHELYAEMNTQSHDIPSSMQQFFPHFIPGMMMPARPNPSAPYQWARRTDLTDIDKRIHDFRDEGFGGWKPPSSGSGAWPIWARKDQEGR